MSGIGIGNILWVIVLTGAGYFALRWSRGRLGERLSALADSGESKWVQLASRLVEKTHAIFLLIVALTVAVQMRTFWPLVVILIPLLLIQATIWIHQGINFWVDDYRDRNLETDAASVTTIITVGFLAKITLYTILVLLILSNLGFKLGPLLAGFGIAGIAVGLALQNILGDLFASLTIVLDKPFVIGDFIIVDDKLGVIEHIGLKTTRVRSLSGEQLIFSNGDLLSSRIRNYKRMQERRVLFNFGVLYQTPHDKMAAIPEMVREIIQAQPDTRFDRTHFKAFGDSSLDFEAVYYLLKPDYNFYMDTQQAINLALLGRFESEGIGFAYPTQTLYIQREGSLESHA
jgi:small-conductance mechanosensitive channel